MFFDENGICDSFDFFYHGKKYYFLLIIKKKKKVIKYFQYCDPSANHCVLTHDCVTV